MTFTTPAEVTEAIEAYGTEDFIDSMTWGESKVDLGEVGEAVYVDGKLGREGGGEDIWFVFSVGDSFFRMEGFYTSYDGSSWEGATPERVFPQEKTITVYVSAEG